MKTRISNGNSKLGKIPNISLTPIKSCGNCSHCKNDCYALKAYRMYPSVKNAWDINYDLVSSSAQNRARFFIDISQYLRKKRPSFFRWHVAGDILDQKYLNSMISTAENYPQVKFLALTKMFHLDYSKTPDNLSIVFSMWTGQRKPRTKKGVAGFAWYQDGTENRVPDSAIECPGKCDSCGMCFDIAKIGGNVVFNKH